MRDLWQTARVDTKVEDNFKEKKKGEMMDLGVKVGRKWQGNARSCCNEKAIRLSETNESRKITLLFRERECVGKTSMER